MPLGCKSLSVEISVYVPPDITSGVALFYSKSWEGHSAHHDGLTLVHLVTGNNKHTGRPAKKAVSKGSRILMAIAKDTVVPQGSTASGMMGGRFAATELSQPTWEESVASNLSFRAFVCYNPAQCHKLCFLAAKIILLLSAYGYKII